jgi:hypothetical protein
MIGTFVPLPMHHVQFTPLTPKHQSDGSQMNTVILKRNCSKVVSHLHHVGIQPEGGNGPSPNTESAGTFIIQFLPSKTVSNEFQFFINDWLKYF